MVGFHELFLLILSAGDVTASGKVRSEFQSEFGLSLAIQPFS